MSKIISLQSHPRGSVAVPVHRARRRVRKPPFAPELDIWFQFIADSGMDPAHARLRGVAA